MARRTQTIDNSQDIIDSRDVIARISDLESQLEDEHNTELEELDAYLKDCADLEETPGNASRPAKDFEDWLKAQADNGNDDATELVNLRAFAEDASGCADWKHGEAFIRESYFKDYARDLHEDINGRDAKSGWPYDYIDWDRATEALLMDYSAYDFDGVTYYARS